MSGLSSLARTWAEQWPHALDLWSPFVQLRDPVFCQSEDEAAANQASGVLAMIRLADQTVVINLPEIEAHGLAPFPLEILAHEIGHHILAPADLSENARLLARVRLALPSVEEQGPMISNLWSDLLINDRLQRDRGLDMAAVFVALADHVRPPSTLWTFYMRTYEILWSLVKGSLVESSLTPADVEDRIEADALLASRVVRTFARRVVRGGGSYAALCLPYLLAETEAGEGQDDTRRIWADAVAAGTGGFPDGLTELDPDELVHPLHDPEISGNEATGEAVDTLGGESAGAASGLPTGQHRQPFDYGEILRATGLEIDDQEAAIRYYRERAIPHLVPFPTDVSPSSTEPLPEGVDVWDIGEPLNTIDWTESLVRSPVVVPGITTVQRVWGTTEGSRPDESPRNLDIYVDSSGSMPDPKVNVSYPALAGAIVALSALRAGASVQATLWSGTRQFTVTDGFVRDERQVMAVLTGHFGGGTAFPLHVLRDTYRSQARSSGSEQHDHAARTHILIVSDEGVDTIYNTDEEGTEGRLIAEMALDVAGGGGTMALNLYRAPDKIEALVAAAAQGWDIHPVSNWDDLVAFARSFSRRTYGASADEVSSAS